MRRALLIAVPATIIVGALWAGRRLQKSGRWQGIWSRLFPVAFYCLAVGFGFMHVFNYEGAFLLALPMLLNPFVGGLFYGYARLRWGLWAAITMHIANNGTAFVLDQLLGW